MMASDGSGGSYVTLVAWLAMLVFTGLLLGYSLGRLDRQENWIRDLQRRIAVLEQGR